MFSSNQKLLGGDSFTSPHSSRCKLKVAVRFPDTVTHIVKYTQFCWWYHIFDLCVKEIQQSVFWQSLPVVGNVGNVGILATFRKGVFSQIQILCRSNHENGKRTMLVWGIYVFGTHWCRLRKNRVSTTCFSKKQNFFLDQALTVSFEPLSCLIFMQNKH